MLTATACLAASLFFGLFALYFYRQNRKQLNENPQLTNVSLRVDRTDLLQKQREIVAQRRKKLLPVDEVSDKSILNPKPSAEVNTTFATDGEDGFGEDLGAALSLKQEPAKPKKPSRFGAMMQAANELADAYKQNNSIQP